MSSSGDDYDFHAPLYVNSLIYSIVESKIATYYDLKYKYSIDDLPELYDMCMVKAYNKNEIVEGSGGKK